MEPIKLRSTADPLEKWIHRTPKGSFSTVYFYDAHDNSINACSSSQIGCVESCRFCATGDVPFVRNLTVDEMRSQFLGSTTVLKSFLKPKEPRLYLLLEGMGEASYNLQNCIQASHQILPTLLTSFNDITLRLSTAGNVGVVEPFISAAQTYTHPSLRYQFQLSLHSSDEEQRKYLIPGFAQKYTLDQTIDAFLSLADRLGQKLKCNYLLLNFNGETNYSRAHLDELVRLLPADRSRVKLTAYSDTGKNIHSPNKQTFIEVAKYLQSKGLQTSIRPLLGSDIESACGMLNYTQ
jgi:23S rRNA (adenine2503-C2)-methyltransferase